MANPQLMTDEEMALLNMSGTTPYQEYSTQPPKEVVERIRMRIPASVPPPEDPIKMKLRDAQESAYREAINTQKQGIAPLEEEYNKYGTNQERDMGGLVAALDYFGNSNNLAGYKRPESEENIKYKKAVIGQMLQKAREGVTESELKRMGQLAENERAKEANARMDRFEFSKDRDAEKQIIEATRKDIVKPTEAFNKLYSEIDSALASGDIKRIKGALNQVARGIQDQKGVLTEGDIGRVMFPQISTDIAEFTAYFGNKEKLEPSDVQYIKDGIEKSRSALGSMSRNQLKAIENDYGTSGTYGHLFREGGSLNRVMRNREKDLDKIFGSPTPQAGYTVDQEAGINRVMKANNISREEAISALKKGGKLN